MSFCTCLVHSNHLLLLRINYFKALKEVIEDFYFVRTLINIILVKIHKLCYPTQNKFDRKCGRLTSVGYNYETNCNNLSSSTSMFNSIDLKLAGAYNASINMSNERKAIN